MKTYVVGLTGQSGAGKTTVCDFFAEAGFGIINCDEIAHGILLNKACKNKVVEAFPTVELVDNEINRKSLGKIVFSDEKALKLLNSITHPVILKEVEKQIEALKKDFSIIIIDAPTLFESGANSLCDTIVAVIAKNEILIKRLCDRDNISEAQAQQRIKKQHDHEFFKANCTYIIKNNGEIDDLKAQAQKITAAVGNDALVAPSNHNTINKK